jgi:hypothetical protein
MGEDGLAGRHFPDQFQRSPDIHERFDSGGSLANGIVAYGAFTANTRHAVTVITTQEDELHASFPSILSFQG